MIYTHKYIANATHKIYVWYREHRHISDYIQFDKTDLINKGGKKVISKSKPFLNIGAGFDCETSKTSDDCNESIVYIWQFSIGKINFLCRDINEIKRFLFELSSMIKLIHKNATLIVFDANISYEYSYFWRLLSDSITAVFAKSTTKVCSFTINNNIKFAECLGVFGTSLANIAKNYTKTQKRKGDLNYNKIRNSHTYLSRKEIMYCVDDVAILSELTQTAHRMFTLNGDNIPLTQTGIVRNEVKKAMCKHFLDKNRLINEINQLIGTENEYQVFRTFLYSGGLTHSNFKYVGIICNDSNNGMHIKCKDLTSAYPWALNAKMYPAGKLVKTSDYKFAIKHKHWIAKLVFKNLRSKSTHSTLSSHKASKLDNAVLDNGRVYKADYAEYYVNEIDMANINAIYEYDAIKIIESWYFTKSSKAPKSMLDVMNNWYIKKTKLKPLTKDSHANDRDYVENCKEYLRLKQLINSVYGMCVTSLYFEKFIFNNGIQIETIDYENAKTTIFNPFIGYWCTAYVRQRLINVISKYPDSIVQYDTDSLYYDSNNTNLEKYFDEINTEVYNEIIKNVKARECYDLGQWDFDGDYINGFIPLGSKRYCGEHSDGTYKITFAGASRDDIIKQAHKYNTPLFEYIKDFSITALESTKKGAVHENKNFEIHTTYVTDYNGNTSVQPCYGYTTIVNVPFNAQLSTNFQSLYNTYVKSINR